MSYKYLIDSSAWMEYLGGTLAAEKIKNIIEQESIATSIIGIAELADKFERDGRNFTSPLSFIQSHAAILPVTIPLTLHAAKLKKKHRAHHSKFGLADALHLATALEENAILVTKDKDFSKEKNVLLI